METKNYFIIPAEGYFTLRLVGQCDYTNIKGALEEINAEVLKAFPHIIVNCEHLGSLSKDWVRLLLMVQKDLKKYNTQMRFILVSPALKAAFRQDGIDTAFKICQSLRAAQVELGLVTKKALDTDFINPFLNATLHVLNVQAQVTADPGKLYLKKNGEKYVGDISSVIGLVSDSFNGSVIISFPEQTFLKIMSNMLGENYTEMSKDIIDGAGEITNMIFGQAKLVLNEKGYGIKSAIPSVVAGKNHCHQAITNGPKVVVPFQSSVGEFFFEISISS